MPSTDLLEVDHIGTATANTRTSAAVAEMATGATTSATAAAAGAAHSAETMASVWATVGGATSAVDGQVPPVETAVASAGAKLSSANHQALTSVINTNEQNRQALTSHPEVIDV